MDELSTIEKADVRKSILDFEELLKKQDGVFLGDSVNCPLKHSFAPGIYVREIFIPAGVVLTGKIHKHEHPNFLMKGKVEVFTESNGGEVLEAPLSMISSAGTKRVVKTITDTIWVTVHHNPDNLTNTDEIEKNVIAENYEQFERFIEGKKSLVNRLKTFISNKLLIK